MRGLTRAVIALIVPPLPAASRPSKTRMTLRPFSDDPGLEMNEFRLEFLEGLEVGLIGHLLLRFLGLSAYFGANDHLGSRRSRSGGMSGLMFSSTGASVPVFASGSLSSPLDLSENFPAGKSPAMKPAKRCGAVQGTADCQ
jgi:hypothetical protein